MLRTSNVHRITPVVKSDNGLLSSHPLSGYGGAYARTDRNERDVSPTLWRLAEHVRLFGQGTCAPHPSGGVPRRDRRDTGWGSLDPGMISRDAAVVKSELQTSRRSQIKRAHLHSVGLFQSGFSRTSSCSHTMSNPETSVGETNASSGLDFDRQIQKNVRAGSRLGPNASEGDRGG